MATPLQGMEYRVIREYPDGGMVIQPESKFNSDGFAKLIYAKDGQLLGRPVTVDLEAGEDGMNEALSEIEELHGIHR